ncbi:TPA: hypothetical protein DF272_06915 [Candidatus Falkowbacteria bacterium]|nr:hypothetical protein [Candidatus Falkowbacteria bacterium]
MWQLEQKIDPIDDFAGGDELPDGSTAARFDCEGPFGVEVEGAPMSDDEREKLSEELFGSKH